MGEEPRRLAPTQEEQALWGAGGSHGFRMDQGRGMWNLAGAATAWHCFFFKRSIRCFFIFTKNRNVFTEEYLKNRKVQTSKKKKKGDTHIYQL